MSSKSNQPTNPIIFDPFRSGGGGGAAASAAGEKLLDRKRLMVPLMFTNVRARARERRGEAKQLAAADATSMSTAAAISAL